MKNLILAVLFLLIVCCCSRSSSDNPIKLGPYSDEVCALIVRTQMSSMIERKEVCCSLRREVERCLDGDTTAHTHAVRLYLDCAVRLSDHTPNSSCIKSDRTLLDSALRLVDSVNYPVMMHRVKAEMLKLEAPFNKNVYFAINREIDYFGSIGDTLAMALLEVSLGPCFNDVGCTEEALEVTQRVMKTFEKIGQPRFVSRTRINEAVYYEALGDFSRRDSVNRILLSDAEIQRNSPIFREGLVRNAYLQLKDTAYLNEGWRIIQADSSLIRRSTAYYAFFADRMLEDNDADSALRLLRRGLEIGDKFGFPNLSHRLLILSTMAKAFDLKMEADSALQYLKVAIHMRDSVSALSNGEEVMRTTYGREIEALKYEQEMRRGRERWAWSVLVMVMILLAIGCFVWVWKQRQSALLRLVSEQAEMERTRHELAAHMLAKQEKDNLLREMNRHIGKMTSEGHMSHSVATDLQTMIRLHETGQKEWEAFEELLVKIRPMFMARLHARAPEMSVKYCRLAAYIYVGMSSSQIAALLMISPKSVYQARWRLRRQLAVPEGVGLEEFLEELGAG